MSARNLIRRTAATAVTAGLLATGAVALATPASAVGARACVHSSVPNENFDSRRRSHEWGSVDANGGLRLRTGPGTQYTAKGWLKNSTFMDIVCTSAGDRWLYGKVYGSGPNRGKWGWVANKYFFLLHGVSDLRRH
ncbi:SH3 domain-containing protein [Streptomyces chattanoogensis]|uniref:SH3 domain-containing protein n=1 Tax=Streptomyces chattanoogensis TaxID=66876 RepID=UPI0036778920